jgi:hypothetical protein
MLVFVRAEDLLPLLPAKFRTHRLTKGADCKSSPAKQAKFVKNGSLSRKAGTSNIEAKTLNIEVKSLNIEVKSLNIKAKTLNIEVESLNIEVEIFHREAGRRICAYFSL